MEKILRLNHNEVLCQFCFSLKVVRISHTFSLMERTIFRMFSWLFIQGASLLLNNYTQAHESFLFSAKAQLVV